MMRSTTALLVLLLAGPLAGAQPDDGPTDPSGSESPFGRRIDDAPAFGAAGAFEEEALERVRAGALGRVFPAQGVVSEVDFAGPTVVIDGLRYDFAADATVTLLSGYGAPTLLQQGMTARFVFEATDDAGTVGRIHRLEQVEADPGVEH
jgi:hypothetical protein